jgi:hypothetical protein
MYLQDLEGDGVSGNDMNIPPSSSSEIKHATNRSIQLYLNGVDQLSFSLFLDDPMALIITRLNHVIKVYRTVVDDAGDPIYTDITPVFAGIVASTVKDGDANIMNVICYSPLWRLQSRFHILNHYLVTNPDTSARYKQSELLWKIIDLVNGAFGGDSYTGITNGVFDDVVDEVTVSPYFIAKGSNSWAHFETILDRPGSVDIRPLYVDNATPTYMEFNTALKRGVDLSGSQSWEYNIDADSQLSNMVEEESVIPGEFANYVWAVGQGGPNSGKVALDENINDDSDGYENIGIYMRRADFPNQKTVGLVGPPSTGLMTLVQQELAQSRVPKSSYTVTISPNTIIYGSDFLLGDVISLSASKGALNFSDKVQRTYDVNLTMSDNNLETLTVLLANDFYGKVAT